MTSQNATGSGIQLFLIVLILVTSISIKAQDSIKYEFDTLKIVGFTPVKDQQRSGTCWSFAAVSFLESEILRTKGISVDLSEMYFVKKAYEDKVRRYVRLHGNTNLSPGGQAHDVTNTLRSDGLVTESAYPGLIGDLEIHHHGELDALLRAMGEVITKKRSGRLTSVWDEAIVEVLDVYLGEVPARFSYEGKEYSTVSFRKFLDLEPQEYIELTSYSHHDWYQPVDLQIPDNWSRGKYYNIPLDEMEELVRHALGKGYSIVWDGDVSEKGFMHKSGLAVNPMKAYADMSDSEKENLGKFMVEEKRIDQESRQKSYIQQSSTDDHLMHLCGMARDQNGEYYYLIKNSWGEDSNEYGGLLWMSSSYFREHTVALMLHKDAVPTGTADACGL